MNSIFSKIISGQLPSFKIAEDDKHFAFLDINPNSIGHTLCVTKKQVDKLLDLKEEEFLNLMTFSRKVAKAIDEAISRARSGEGPTFLEMKTYTILKHLLKK